MGQIIWTDIAAVELKAIHDYIFQYSVQSAENLIEGILRNVDYINNYPGTGTPVKKFSQLGLRHRYFKSYKIFYIEKADTIYIITILHKSRLFNLSLTEIRSLIKF